MQRALHSSLSSTVSGELAAVAAVTGGLFAVNKPPGISSAGVIDYIKRNVGLGGGAMPFDEHFENERLLRKAGKKIYRKKTPTSLRIGHAGTLDVEASGVLVLGVESGCKLLSQYLKGDKAYLATGKLGLTTDSYDAEGMIMSIRDTADVTSSMILDAIPQFVGDIEQIPSSYSAIRVDGKRLYQYMRDGEKIPVEIKPRTVHISDIKLLYYRPHKQTSGAGTLQSEVYGNRVKMPAAFMEYFTSGRYAWDEKTVVGKEPCVGEYMFPFINQPNASTIQLLVTCGGGVYIRSLIKDLGEQLGCGATMAMLVRMAQGPMHLGRDTIDVHDLPYTARIVEAMRRTQVRVAETSASP
ncbi:pseudouridine synthase pus4 [Coemansia sp. RSA 1285]|nr:pseudouridine synthase pus4 [Coemansia sp. RSA 1285]